MFTTEDIRREYDRLDALCGVDTGGVAVVISDRAVRRLGSFTPGPPPRITISAFVLADEGQFWDTIRHEYAHAVVWLRHPGERHGHDGVWKAVCREVGCTPRAASAPLEVQASLREEQARYRVVCNGCGAETLYLREGKIWRTLCSGRKKHVRCARCGGNDFSLYYREAGHP